jgi:hypothetical protein
LLVVVCASVLGVNTDDTVGAALRG